jgi:uncharacterized membrane protein YphA (DoxX/SURF4 family)
MENLTKTGRIFYGLALIGVGIHQLFYADFCPFIFPSWPNPIAGYAVLACIVNVALIIAGAAIAFNKQAKTVALILGGVLLLMLIAGQIPYEYIVVPYKKTHLGLWALPLKELALAGGAFCIAGSFASDHRSGILGLLEKLIPFGRIFFAITMFCFGLCHFLYADGVAAMVPSWIPAHSFWSYLAGSALMAGALGIALNILLKPAAIALGTMIFIWFLCLHIPSAVAHPLTDKGNEITAAFSALAFSGIAFVIAGRRKKVG